jgi:hypothetical protein
LSTPERHSEEIPGCDQLCCTQGWRDLSSGCRTYL